MPESCWLLLLWTAVLGFAYERGLNGPYYTAVATETSTRGERGIHLPTAGMSSIVISPSGPYDVKYDVSWRANR